VELAEIAEEVPGGDEVAPSPADEGGAGEGGGPRREAAQYHRKKVVAVQHRGRRRPQAGDGLGLGALGPVLRLGFGHFVLGRFEQVMMALHWQIDGRFMGLGFPPNF
jgi:hypothetical protein